MIQHGSQYELLRKLNSLNESTRVETIPLSDKITFIQEKLKENLAKSHKQYEKTYNLRCKPVKFNIGQEVFKRNFILSDKGRNINSKFCKKFQKCRIRGVVGQNRYELEDLNGQKSLGVYHAKDIRA